MDEVAEQQQIANELSEAISNPVGFGNEYDEVKHGGLGLVRGKKICTKPLPPVTFSCQKEK